MDRFRTMETFVRVARSGSFTIAADQLNLSRALVSRHVSDLEQRLGARLLNRSTRSLNLTDEGRSYLDFCEQLFRDIEGKEQTILRTRTEPVGTLKLTAPKSFGSLHLADAIIAFARAQPRLQVSLLLENVTFHPSDFNERDFDLALRLTSMRNTAVIERSVATLDWVVCASPDYLVREGRPASPAELADHSCLVHVNALANDRVWRFDGPRGAISAKVTGVFASNSALALRKAALSGMGIALLPRYCVADDLAAGMLVALLPRYKVPARPLFAVYPRATAVPQKVGIFVDFLSKWMTTRDVNRASPHIRSI